MTSAPRAKKSLGQHFLKYPETAERIVQLLRPQDGDQVLEIGPGPGALTVFLRRLPLSRLLLVEKDDHWAATHAAEAMPHLEVRHADALTFPWESLQGPWKIIGNLPYNVASPLMWDMVRRVPQLSRAVFMIQKEVAERVRAAPGGRDYGALSVWIQSHVRVEWGFVVGPGCFSPPPKVDSAVVAFSPRPPHDLCFSAQALSKTLKLCFQQRRKQLQSLLRQQGVAESTAILEGLGIDPQARPETLSPGRFQDLAHALFPDSEHDGGGMQKDCPQRSASL